MAKRKIKPKIMIICDSCGYNPVPKKENVWNIYNMKCKCGKQLKIKLIQQEKL